MKTLIFLLLISSAQAAQEIPLDQVTNVFSKIESRITHNPSDNIDYVWGRFIGTGVYSKWRYCFLSPVGNFNPFGSVRTVINPSNGRWFITNAAGIESNPSDLDWCTQ